MQDHVRKQQIPDIEINLAFHKALHSISNRIHNAQSIHEILVNLKESILGLFSAHGISIYAVDEKRNEIYSLLLVGTQLKEIRLAINKKSIAGYVAATKESVNISDVYNAEELRNIDADLAHDGKWDKITAFRTREILATPILCNNNLMGVIQLVNNTRGHQFSAQAAEALREVSDILGIAFSNHTMLLRKLTAKFSYLIARGLIKAADLTEPGDEFRNSGETLEKSLMNKFRITKKDIGASLEEFYRCEFVEFDDGYVTPEDLLTNLGYEYLKKELWCPVESVNGRIKVVMDDPNDILKRDSISALLKSKSIDYCVGLREDILSFIDLFYGIGRELDAIDMQSTFKEKDDEQVTETDSVIVQLVNRMIFEALKKRASDIHIEPNSTLKSVNIRFRIDGECIPYRSYPYSYRWAILSRLKIMANLDITERRLPQDGKIKFKPGGSREEIELRIATIPTHGDVEDVVMRILRKGKIMVLDEISLTPTNHKKFMDVLKKPYGLILVVGPTGSGKTTTLHAALHCLNQPNSKIWTAEDPVEITQLGLRQVQINRKIGLDFSQTMRALLRADPDIIMIGEMRDYETAKISIEASSTGHLVLSTLHTNNAPETVVRLLDIGVDPFNFADSLLCVLAQRLVRKLCNSCRIEYHPTEEEFNNLVNAYGEKLFPELDITYDHDFKLYKANGCKACNDTGYYGMIAISELLAVTDHIKQLVSSKKSASIIRKVAIDEGMRTLLQDGIIKALNGKTDITEIYGVCMR